MPAIKQWATHFGYDAHSGQYGGFWYKLAQASGAQAGQCQLYTVDGPAAPECAGVPPATFTLKFTGVQEQQPCGSGQPTHPPAGGSVVSLARVPAPGVGTPTEGPFLACGTPYSWYYPEQGAGRCEGGAFVYEGDGENNRGALVVDMDAGTVPLG